MTETTTNCTECGARPAAYVDGPTALCHWCDSLCTCCGERPIESAMRWGRRDGLAADFCPLCREPIDAEEAGQRSA